MRVRPVSGHCSCMVDRASIIATEADRANDCRDGGQHDRASIRDATAPFALA